MKRTVKHYSQSFKQQVLDDFFQSNVSERECARKWNIPRLFENICPPACLSPFSAVPLSPNALFFFLCPIGNTYQRGLAHSGMEQGGADNNGEKRLR